MPSTRCTDFAFVALDMRLGFSMFQLPPLFFCLEGGGAGLAGEFPRPGRGGSFRSVFLQPLTQQLPGA